MANSSSSKPPASRASVRSKSPASKGQRGARGSVKASRFSLSKEAWSVVALIGSVLVAVGAYTHVLGPLGAFFHGFLAVLFGNGGWVVVVLGAVVSFGVLAGLRYAKSSWVWLDVVVLQLTVASIYGVLHEVHHHGHFSFVGVVHYGGVFGELLGYVFIHLAGETGAFVVISIIALISIFHLLGLHLEKISSLMSNALRDTRQGVISTRSNSSNVSEPELDSGAAGSRRRGEHVSPVLSKGELEPEPLIYDIPIFSPHSDVVEKESRRRRSKRGVEDSDPDVKEKDDVIDLSLIEDLQDNAPAKTTATSEVAGNWRLPPRTILSRGSKQKLDKAELIERGNALQSSLGTFGVGVKVVGMTVGPTVTRYELELAEGVKVSRLLALHRDIAYAMAATDVRILAPIPGRSAVGVEVPNRTRETVTLGDVMASAEMSRATHPLQVPIGKDIAGSTVVANLAEMPHVLIAGSTGSGKSSALNSILTSILMRSTPEEVRLILIDPKRVELGQYSRLPHLLTSVVVDPKKAANALAWAVKEMENRYDLLAAVGVRDITGYNALIKEANKEGVDKRTLSMEIFGDPTHEDAIRPLPFILVVVDELNDLMMVAARDVEDSICRIAQKARAVGIHLIIATQRPSVDVITGVIKANVPSRIAFSVASLADSRVVLDQSGAEKLVGKGDLLMITASSSHPRRVQAPWVSESEVRQVVSHWLRLGGPSYIEGVEGDGNERESVFGGSSQDDELYKEAVRLVVTSQLGSTSMLQRKLKVGFARAGRIMDLLEQGGIVGPPEGSKPRAVLVTPEQLEELNI